MGVKYYMITCMHEILNYILRFKDFSKLSIHFTFKYTAKKSLTFAMLIRTKMNILSIVYNNIKQHGYIEFRLNKIVQ